MTAPTPQAAFAPGSHPIAAYGRGAFAFAGMQHEGSILATPAGVRGLAAGAVADLTPETLAPLFDDLAATPDSIEFVVFGTGERLAPLPASLRETLRGHGLRFEAMATGPALRVYNMMQAEGRRVAAALIAAP